MSMAGGSPETRRRRDPSASSDSWDFDPDADLPDTTYRGSRRADVPRHRRPAYRFGLLAVVLAIAVVGGAWFAFTGGGDSPDAASARGGGATGPSADGNGSPSASASASADATTPAPTPEAQAVIVEAEAGMPAVKLRAAQVVAQAGASGGRVVRFTSDAGQIQLRSLSLPAAGTYRFTIYYAPADEATGRLVLGTASPISVFYEPGSGCCAAAEVDASVPGGVFNAELTLSQEDGQPPAIDRVVITPV